METRPPAVTVEVEVIPDHGRRPVPLRFRSQAEVRALIAAVARDMDMLPEGDMDGLPLVDLPSWWMPQVVDCEIADDGDEPGITFARLVEELNPMGRSHLRSLVASAWRQAPRVIEQAVIDIQKGRTGLDPVPVTFGPPLSAAEIAELNAAARADACGDCGRLVCDCAAGMGEDPTDGIAEGHDADAECTSTLQGFPCVAKGAHAKHLGVGYAWTSDEADAAAVVTEVRFSITPEALALGESIASGTPVIITDDEHPDCARPGCQHPRHHHWEFGPTTPSSPAGGCDMTGCPCSSYAATFAAVASEIRDLRAADAAAALAASAVSVVLCGLPVWGDEDRPCELIAGHGPVVSCPGMAALLEDAAAHDADAAAGVTGTELVLCQAHGGEFGPADCDKCAADAAHVLLAAAELDIEMREPEDMRSDPPSHCHSVRVVEGKTLACGNVPGHIDPHYFQQRDERWEWDASMVEPVKTAAVR